MFESQVRRLLQRLDLSAGRTAGECAGHGLACAAAAPGEALPAELRRSVEALVKLRHCAGRYARGGKERFVLPPWLTATHEMGVRNRLGPLRVDVDPSATRRIAVHGDATRQRIGTVVLSQRTPAAWRRRCIIQAATTLGRALEDALGAAPAWSEWLAEMESAPEKVEQAGIRVWHAFLAALDVPRGLRIPGFERTLADLLLVLDGPGGGADREWFTNQWPAAAAALLAAGIAPAEFRRIDDNRAAAVAAATAAFCCRDRPDCPYALPLARQMPKYRRDSCLARALAGHGSLKEVHIRAILTRANQEEGGSLLRRMAQCSAYARDHVELAAATAVQPVLVSNRCRMAVGQLILLTFAGSGFDPARLDPASIASSLTTVAAVCLAAFVPPWFVPAAGRVDAGVTALAIFLAAARRRPSPRQFVRFIGVAERLGSHPDRQGAGIRERDPWPPPVAWREDDRRAARAIILPLLTSEAVRAEGRVMKNCLASTTTFTKEARSGHVALFSIQAGASRATLAVELLHRGGAIASHRIGQLEGPDKAPPTRACESAARFLVERLNARLPLPVPAAIEQWRTGLHYRNARRLPTDRVAASAIWQLYVRSLPARFRSTSPVDVVNEATGRWQRRRHSW